LFDIIVEIGIMIIVERPKPGPTGASFLERRVGPLRPRPFDGGLRIPPLNETTPTARGPAKERSCHDEGHPAVRREWPSANHEE
jgi:hypothetical protein